VAEVVEVARVVDAAVRLGELVAVRDVCEEVDAEHRVDEEDEREERTHLHRRVGSRGV
jgi:hypothetical protein